MKTETQKPATMADLLRHNIKDIIAEYPAVGDALGHYDIGCVTCSVGTCQLKDIISIHNLSPDQERALFGEIAQIIFPGEAVELPKTEPKLAIPVGNRKLSPPIQELIAEHKTIKRVIALIPGITANLKVPITVEQKQLIAGVIDFIRHYADRFHHAKEEDILFKYFDESSDILSIMLKEHEIGRAHVRAVAEALERGDATAIKDHLTAYGALLSEHVRKEDEILYPWMDRELADAQIGQLYAAFRAVEERFGAQPARYQAKVVQWESMMV